MDGSPKDALETRIARIRDTEAAKDELEKALSGAGVVLPSLGLDAVCLASDYLPPLVELGRCNPATARKLAAALRGRRAELLAKVNEANRQSIINRAG
jgi:hypothetical protein